MKACFMYVQTLDINMGDCKLNVNKLLNILSSVTKIQLEDKLLNTLLFLLNI